MSRARATNGVRHAVAAVVFVCMVPLDAAARDPWGSILVPGGAAAARQVATLGSPDRPAVDLLIDLAYAVHAQRLADGADPVATLREYFDYVIRLRAALDAATPGRPPHDAPGAAADDGPQLDQVRDLLGLRLDPSADPPSVLPDESPDARRRAQWLAALGIDRHDVIGRLSAGQIPVVQWTDDAIPLPLPDLWRTVVFDGRPASIDALLSSPDNLLLYLGLVNLDAQTLAWIGTRGDVFETLAHRDLVGPFAAFGRSLHVRDAAVVTPGNADDRRLWEMLIGARAVDPASFIRRVLTRDRGRMAYFYDTAASLDERSRAFLLGAQREDAARPGDRLRFARRVYEAFVRVAPTWRARERPFFRPIADPGLVLASVDVAGDGAAGPSWWTALLERAFDDCTWTRTPAPLRERPAAADAHWLLTWVFETSAEPVDRLAGLRLLQRRFRDEPVEAAGDIEVAVCARRHLPALALGLDRIGVSRPATYARLALISRRLARAGDGEVALRVWQGALALVEQAARHRGLPPSTVDDLLLSLADAAPDEPDEIPDAVASWVFGDLLPGLGARTHADAEIETGAIAALVGLDRRDDLEFAWDGLEYRLDEAGAAARSVSAIRAASMGPRLDHLRRLLDTNARLGSVPAAGDVDAALAALRDASSALYDRVGTTGRGSIGGDIETAMRPRERANAAFGDRRPVDRGVLRSLTHEVAADVLPGLAYALAMSPSAAPPEIYAEAYRFHSLGADAPGGGVEAHAWAVPQVLSRPEGGSRVRGAMLGLDLARAPDQLRRVSSDRVVERPVITETDYQAGSERLVLRARGAEWERAGAEVAAAMARGRAVVAGWAAGLPPDDVVEHLLMGAAVSPRRVNFVRWLLTNASSLSDRESALDRYFTPTDFYRLGTSAELPDAWGQSGWLVEACWCLRSSGRRPPEDWLGRSASLALSSSSDLPLRLTELLASLGLPHALLEPLLPMALQDAIDHAQQISTADWEAFARPRHLTASRIESYLLELVAEGLLAAPRGGGR